MSKNRSQLLRDAADSCDELACDYRRESKNMGPTKGASYIRMAEDSERDAQALIAWAEEMDATGLPSAGGNTP